MELNPVEVLQYARRFGVRAQLVNGREIKFSLRVKPDLSLSTTSKR
jgi:hypothetical protein